MSEKETGGPAFPQSTKRAVAGLCGSLDRVVEDIWGGMTLRDYFAAKAMQAYIGSFPGITPDWRDADQWVPSKAYEMADAMLEARK